MQNNYITEEIYNAYFKNLNDINVKTTSEQIKPSVQNNSLYQNEDSARTRDKEYSYDTNYEVKTVRHVADENIDDIEQLASILKSLCNAAWGSNWGELSPDLKTGEDSSTIILPQITVDINTRDVAEDMGGLKPRLVDITTEKDEAGNETGDSFLIYRQWFDCNVEFDIYGQTNREARYIQKRLETLISVYAGYLKRHGISEIIFEREVSPKNSCNYIETVPMRCIYYYVRFETITPIRQSTINRINLEMGISNLDSDKLRHLIESSNNKVHAVDIDFFNGDNGITYDLK